MRHELTPMIRLDHNQIAKLAHEALRTVCLMFQDAPPAPWADAHDQQKRSMTNLVARLAEHPNITAHQVHDQHVAQQRAEGWSYGVMRCTVTKKSPLLLPWEELSHKYRAKQGFVFAMVRHLLYPEREVA